MILALKDMASNEMLPGGVVAPMDYNAYIERMRTDEYPMLKDATYLDHAGTTLYSKTQMERFHADMMANLYGNPHSASPSSHHSTQQIEHMRLDLLRFFNADPAYFELVFTANATAGVKMVIEAFREEDGGFWYGYHVDSHTSLVGVREAAKEQRCFGSNEDVERWLDQSDLTPQPQPQQSLGLFAYPAQSNMNGRRLPLDWCGRVRQRLPDVLTLLDAAAYASTSQLDLSDSESAPDFTVLSLYKIFGFPDLGALIVRKGVGHIFQRRRYFGGGTVDLVVCIKENWHAKKSGALHEQLEDGTLPIHNILALGSAMKTHKELYGELERVSKHTAFLAKTLYEGLSSLRHANDTSVCNVYKHATSDYSDRRTQGPVIAFNLKDSNGNWVSNTEVEKLATIKDIHLRTGGLCNPGGIATTLDLSPWEMKDNFSAGYRCGSENDIMNGKPTGMIRVSFGAMSTLSDVQVFLAFVDEFFVDDSVARPVSSAVVMDAVEGSFHVDSLTVYPIKSCAGWQIPSKAPWEVRREGLAWDREWCIVHQGTGAALSQKRYPRMALIRPHLDLMRGLLRIRTPCSAEEVTVPLSADPTPFGRQALRDSASTVCGDPVNVRQYTSLSISEVLTQAVGVPCTLARFPASTVSSPSTRHSKAHIQHPNGHHQPRSILLSNESPILTISRSSLNRLNEEIKAKGGKAAHPSVFRANIVLAESPLLPPGREQPFAEDRWTCMRIVSAQNPALGVDLDFLGGCRRCQMVCVDQTSAEKNEEPFVTLAKTRRFGGRILFGVHTALRGDTAGHCPTIRVGDVVQASAADAHATL